jgi:hypothetical protein
VTVNCRDVCILEWCKLFADSSDPHYWRNVISAPAKFEETLYKRMRVPAPRLDLALSAARIYYSEVLEVECKPQTARSFPQDLFDYYAESSMGSAKVRPAYMEARDLRTAS